MKSIFGFLKMFMKWCKFSILVALSSAAAILSFPVHMVLNEDEEDRTINDLVQETKEQNKTNDEKVKES